MHRRDAVERGIDLRHKRAEMELLRELTSVEVSDRRRLNLLRINLRIGDRLLPRLDDQMPDRFAFLLEVALKVSPAAADDINRFHGLVCPVGSIPEREYARGWETWQKLQAP